MEQFELKRFISDALKAGQTLEKIQQILADEHNVHMTFMELRLLAAELEDVNWETFDEKPETEKPLDHSDDKASTPPISDATGEPNAPAAGETVVEISKIVKVGAVLSGSVTFISGASAQWYLTREGALGFENVKGAPTPEDQQDFMEKLQDMLSR